MRNETGREASAVHWSRRARRFLPGLEVLAIVLWAIAFGRPYLNFDPAEVPAGFEYSSTIQSAHIWTRARQCGLCALWNGSLRGGAPAFVDPLGPHMHPLVILTTLVFGVPNGSKLAIVGAFIMAGLAQWWLGRALGLGFPGRMFGAAMAVVGGHLANRMELGSFPMLFSAAACSVVFAPLLLLARTGTRRAAILLGIALALAAMSGQGYIQMGMLFSLPIPLLVLFGQPGRVALLGRRLLLAAVVATLLAAPLLLPFAHFFREFAKEKDPLFQCAQEFSLTPLNLVVSDRSFYALYTSVQHRFSWPGQYLCYVGFLPVVLAFFGARWGRDRHRRREVLFLCLSVVAALWFASRDPILWMFSHSPPPLPDFLSGIRFPFYFVTLAVPSLLALAGMGLERLVEAARVRTLQGPWKGRLAGIGLAGSRGSWCFFPSEAPGISAASFWRRFPARRRSPRSSRRCARPIFNGSTRPSASILTARLLPGWD